MRVSFLVSLLAATVLAIVTAAQQPRRFDVLLINGRIVDGTGAPWFRGDVGIVGDRITAIGPLKDAAAGTTIDAAGLVVAPGFIDLLGQSEFNVLVDGRAASKLLQGVTTEVTGEGSSIAPVNDRMIGEATPSATHFGIVIDWRTLGDYLRRLDMRSRPAINVGTFVGAGGIRNYVVGKDDRAATPAELERMKQLVAEAMQEGALGLSTSLQYVPDRFASTDEIVELAKVAARHGGVYFTHQRSESARIFESLDEVFAIAERAAIPAEVWHLKTAYKANFGKMPDVLKRIEAARARGTRSRRIITRHVLPNAIGPAIVQATILMGFALQIEAALSFLGLGAQPPTSSLGVMLADGRNVLTQAPWVEVFPGLAIAITVLAFNFFGDGLRSRLDPAGVTE